MAVCELCRAQLIEVAQSEAIYERAFDHPDHKEILERVAGGTNNSSHFPAFISPKTFPSPRPDGGEKGPHKDG